MPFCGKCFLDDAFGGLYFDGIEDRFLRNSDALFTKGLQDIRLRNAFKTLELDVANDRKLFNFKNHHHATTRSILRVNASANFFKEVQREDRLKITRDCRFAVDISSARLNVIENIFFAQAAVTYDVDVFNQTRLRLLCRHRRAKEQAGCADYQAECGEQDDAIRVHK